jgi:hypothetical protein
MAVVESEQKRPFYHFITTMCALIGGLFTVMGIMKKISALAEEHQQ